ncbi:hypothetical protein [Mesobacillus maritimus]|nr:hypothetical protein [Mesobacillus maritimus]
MSSVPEMSEVEKKGTQECPACPNASEVEEKGKAGMHKRARNE